MGRTWRRPSARDRDLPLARLRPHHARRRQSVAQGFEQSLRTDHRRDGQRPLDPADFRLGHTARIGQVPLAQASRLAQRHQRACEGEPLANRGIRLTRDIATRTFCGEEIRKVAPTQPHRIRDTTASRIWTAYEQVRGYEPVLRWADVETLHDLRIAAKWLRYSLEFVREALGDDSAPLIARITALQDHLGLMNDADVAASMARTFLVEHAGDLSALEGAAIGRYLVSREREVTRLRRSVGPAWRGLAGVGFRRGLGRVVAGL